MRSSFIIIVGALFGLAAGIGGYTFVYAKGGSYLTDDHARSGVTCADCHMPYTRAGGLKVSDHHVRSPLLNINSACQVCHNWPEEDLRGRVFAIQDRTFELRSVAMDALRSGTTGTFGYQCYARLGLSQRAASSTVMPLRRA